MQQIQLIGNLGKDIEERYTSKEVKVLSFPLAVKISKEESAWWQCTIWEKRVPLFEGLVPWLLKGARVYMIGDFLPPAIWRDRSGEQKINLKVEPIKIEVLNFAKERGPVKKKESEEQSDFF